MFLHQVAQDIIYKQNFLSRYCLIFPNKRSGAYFKKYYAQIIGKSSWAPDIYTIDSLIKKFTNLQNPDKLSLLFDLYDIFKKLFTKDNKNFFKEYTFDKFFSIGETILSDFNLLDNYLVNISDIYQNIQDYESINYDYAYFTDEQKQTLREFWQNFAIDNQSDEKTRFIELWNKLPIIYTEFTNNLLKKKLAYTGLRNRFLAVQIEKDNIHYNNYDNYVFIGFNALTKSEKKLFQYLKTLKRAKFYWDFDEYYIKDKNQEAGMFLRENLKKFPNELQEKQNYLLKNDKKIELIGVPLNVGQAKSIPTILNNFNIDLENTNDLQKTVIITPDEQLLFPILHSIPNEVESVNITLGFPLKDTTLFSLIENWLKLKNNFYIKQNYYYKDLINILQHPFVREKLGNLSSTIITHIETANMVYINSEYLTSYKNEFINILFANHNDESETKLLTDALNILFQIFSPSKKDEKVEKNKKAENIENEYIYQVYTEIKRLLEIIQNKSSKIQFNYALIIKLLRQILFSIRIPFEGKTIEGLQLTTLMETRNLDFENVIILSMNEGVVPNTSQSSTFISQSMRLAFELPVIKFQDAIFSYYFYSIIQRAKNIALLYNNITGSGSASGELSRFVQQLIFETDLKIEHKQFKQNLQPVKKQHIILEKNNEILDSLQIYYTDNKKIRKQFSASAINTFIDCSLRFYFRYIAKIKTSTQVEEEITPLVYGNILHNTIEMLYKDFTKNNNSSILQKDDFNVLMKNIVKYVELAFKKEYNLQKEQKFKFTGTNIIIRETIIKHIENILKIDKKHAPFEIIDLEEKYGYSVEIETEINEAKRNVTIRGIFDRIDKKDNIVRLVDYKTGSVKKKFSSVINLFDPENSARNRTILQILYYCLIYQKKFQVNDFKPGVYNIRDMTKDKFNADIYLKKEPVGSYNLPLILPDYEQELSKTISKIFDKEIPFTQTKNERNCEYCDYKNICGKN